MITLINLDDALQKLMDLNISSNIRSMSIIKTLINLIQGSITMIGRDNCIFRRVNATS